jgi:hypothetical protein
MYMNRQASDMRRLADSPDYPLALSQADQARSDFAAIESDLQFVNQPARPAANAGLFLSDVATDHGQPMGAARGRGVDAGAVRDGARV